MDLNGKLYPYSQVRRKGDYSASHKFVGFHKIAEN